MRKRNKSKKNDEYKFKRITCNMCQKHLNIQVDGNNNSLNAVSFKKVFLYGKKVYFCPKCIRENNLKIVN